MVTEILQAVANSATQIGLDVGDLTGIGALIATVITFFLTYRHGTSQSRHA